MFTRIRIIAALAIAAIFGTANAASLTDSLKKGSVNLKSAGALAFGPEGLLFVADAKASTIYAIATSDTKSTGMGVTTVEKLDDAIASMVGTTADQILVNDMKVNPASGNVFLSVVRGKGPDAAAMIIKVGSDGKPSEVSLKDIPNAFVKISNASEKRINESVTSMSFVKGSLYVSGITSEEWESNLRSIPFPFTESSKGTGVKIYHGAHGAFETRAPIQTFTAYDIAGQTHLLASYVCTPLVKFPLSDLKAGEKVTGTTVAELGNRNRPLDIVIYSKDGKDFALLANSARGVMKVDLTGIDKAESITTRINGVAGLKYEKIDSLQGVVQLDKVSNEKAVVLVKDKSLTLKSIDLP